MSAEVFPIRGGAFVAIVGPSGSGKDSVMRFARQALEREAPGSVHFARRVITREADDDTEAHDSCTAEAFYELRASGGLALSWGAHGCQYGIPAEVDVRVREGMVVVANLSRSALGAMRARYARAFAVEITAPLPVLARRIAARGRESGAAVQTRLNRSERFGPPAQPYDLVIDNGGSLETAGDRLIKQLLALVSQRAEEAPPRP